MRAVPLREVAQLARCSHETMRRIVAASATATSRSRQTPAAPPSLSREAGGALDHLHVAPWPVGRSRSERDRPAGSHTGAPMAAGRPGAVANRFADSGMRAAWTPTRCGEAALALLRLRQIVERRMQSLRPSRSAGLCAHARHGVGRTNAAQAGAVLSDQGA